MKKFTNISKALLQFMITIVFVVSVTGWAQAGSLQYDLNTIISGTSPGGTLPWISATFIDVGTNNVQLTMTASNLTGTQFISGLYFNLDPGLDASLLAFTPGTNPVGSTTITQAADCCKADGDGFYDFRFDFPTANNPTEGRFQPSESVVYNIAYTGSGSINVNSFNYLSAPGGGTGNYIVAAHVQGINGVDSTSGWVATATVVPEPVSSTLFVIGGVALGFRSFRKMRKV
jgi:hypothetical protein